MTFRNRDTNSLAILKHWSEVDWTQVKSIVSHLRRRIFHAKVDGNFRKLRCLQRLMLKSSSNILLSIRDISGNSGRKTPGIDRKILDSPQSKLSLFYEILEKGI